MIKNRLSNGRLAPAIPLRKWTIKAMAQQVIGPLPTPCWIIPGCEITYCGQARYHWNRKRIPIHRASYEIFKGPIPKGLCVCHHCDNPPCCNPDHLFLATNKENTADRVAKGRSAKGEKSGMAKLTETQVMQIRSLLSENKRRGLAAGLARQFDVSPCTISAINHDRNWKHLSEGGV